ncbi:Alpha/Beta hydrolase protein [Camillea tinctor]|nr:Alpha/Beta hydrolase protein [Camillea tinctor]
MEMGKNSPEPGMQYAYLTANDGCTLALQTSRPLAPPDNTKRAKTPGPRVCILLLHGFSGSSTYFTRNYAALSARHWVVAPDMRGHGNSGRPRGGYHVSRLAADLHAVLAHLRRRTSPDADEDSIRFVPVGCSIGAAVVWTYVELFAARPFAGYVFVDQAPLQDRCELGGAWDERYAHLGCYDEATARAAQHAWTRRPDAAHRDLVRACLGYRHAPEPADGQGAAPEQARRDEDFFVRISAQCDGEWLARLLADHTRYDHREAIEDHVRGPTLVMAGRRTGCFPLEGMMETVRRVNKNRPGLAKMSLFDAGHWLFYEEPERFNREIVDLFGIGSWRNGHDSVLSEVVVVVVVIMVVSSVLHTGEMPPGIVISA